VCVLLVDIIVGAKIGKKEVKGVKLVHEVHGGKGVHEVRGA